MFDKDLNITGKHGDYMRKIVAELDSDKDKFFRFAYDAYRCAAVIGFLYGRKAQKQTSSKDDYTIFLSQIKNIQNDLDFNYKLIMLLDKEYESNFDNRLNKAFNYSQNERPKEDVGLFEQYTLGGIEVLYEKLIKNANKPEDYISNLMGFIQEFNDRFNSSVDSVNLVELCRSASAFNE